MTDLTKNRLFTAVENGFYHTELTWKHHRDGTHEEVKVIRHVKVAVIKLNYKDHTRVVLSTTFKGRSGYQEFDPEAYGKTWALTRKELEK